MLILLRDDVLNVGKAGDVVKVKDGYARNFLIPKGFAYPATDSFINMFEEEKKSKKFRETRLKKSAEYVKEQIEGKTFKIQAKIGDNGKMFGSVTTRDIAELLLNDKIEIDKKKIMLDDNIKELGIYNIEYKLHGDIKININLRVENENGEIELETEEEEKEETEEEVTE